MVVTGFYWGSQQVQKVYWGKELVWENGTPIILYGEAESKSYAKAAMYLFELPVMHGVSESTSYAVGLLSTLELLPMEGIGESNMNADVVGYIFPANLISGVAESDSDMDSTGHIWRSGVMNADETSVSYAPGSVRMVDAALGSGYSESSNNAQGVGVAAKPVSGSSVVEHTSYAIALIDSVRRVYIISTAESTSFTDTAAKAVDTITISSSEVSYSNVLANGSIIPLLSVSGKGEYASYVIATLTRAIASHMRTSTFSSSNVEATTTVNDAVNAEGVNDSSSDTYAVINLWYMPIVDRDILEIRQAYNVVEEVDLLEVM